MIQERRLKIQELKHSMELSKKDVDRETVMMMGSKEIMLRQNRTSQTTQRDFLLVLVSWESNFFLQKNVTMRFRLKRGFNEKGQEGTDHT